MNEVEKMRSSQLADMSVPEIQVKFEHAKRLLAKMRVMSTYDEDYRSLLEELVPGIPATSIICPPFHCDHGDGIRLGEHVFVNANCTFLDGGYITIGAHTLVGPCVQIYTPHHPMDYIERRTEKEYAYPVTIGEDCWIGGGGPFWAGGPPARHTQRNGIAVILEHGAHQGGSRQQTAKGRATSGTGFMELFGFADDLGRVHAAEHDAAVLRQAADQIRHIIVPPIGYTA